MACACQVYDPIDRRSGSDAATVDGAAASLDGGADATTDGATPDPACRVNSNPEFGGCLEVCPESCNGEDDDCDGEIDDGASCASPHTRALCQGGACLIVACRDGYRDCDGLASSGCEIAPGDPQHCGACMQACAFTSATPNGRLDCGSGECEVVCDAGRGNCDSEYENGCEVDLLTAVANCGTCGSTCSGLAQVAASACSAGSCSVTTCAAGWSDCDGSASNGCEHDSNTLGPCAPDTECTRLPFGSHEYFFCRNLRTYDAARARCGLQTGGELVHVDTAMENDFVTMFLEQNSWLGATDAREGTFRWQDDGVPFWLGTSSGAAVLENYAHFASGQPDDASASEDCVELLSDGTWNDTACNTPRGFVCEVAPDECDADANKRDPGQCGCGIADTDSDADGFADCVEACDSEVAKQAPGLCGCAVPDSSTDSDSDGVLDCNDGCDADPTQTTACLGYQPVNFDPEVINWSAEPVTTLNCGTTTIDTSDPDGTGPAVVTFGNWCGTAPTPRVQAQSGGPDLVIIPMRSLDLVNGNTLRLIGNRPVVLAADGNVTIAGILDANAAGTTPGAGGNWSCGTSQGADSTGGTCLGGAAGGGGGGFATAGGRGGGGGAGMYGAGGVARGANTLTPLLGGCLGGLGGGEGADAAGGAGGGSVQLVAAGTLLVSGTIRANGAAGAVGACGNEAGGGGGGSGGAILLEASTIVTTGGTLLVSGGNGGASGSNAAGGTGAAAAAASGAPGAEGGANGGGGGGGGYGRTRSIDH